MKLEGNSNYMSCLLQLSYGLWFKGFDDHRVKNGSDIAATERTKWNRIDAQLCSLLWNSLNPLLLNIIHALKLAGRFGLKLRLCIRMMYRTCTKSFQIFSNYNKIIKHMASYYLLGANTIS